MKQIILVFMLAVLMLVAVGCKGDTEPNKGKDDSRGSTLSDIYSQNDDDSESISDKMQSLGSDSVMREDEDGDVYPNATRIIETIINFGGYNTAVDSQEGSTRTFDPADKETFDGYVDTLKELGYTKSKSSAVTKDGYKFYYLAQDKDGVYCEVKVSDTETTISVFSDLSYIE